MRNNVYRITYSEEGFTIIEIVVVLFFIALIGTALFAVFTEHNKIYNFEQALIKATGSARTSLNEITEFGLQAHRVIQSQTVNSVAYTSGAQTLILQLPAIDSSGSIINGTYDYVVFNLSGSTLTEQIQAGSGSARATGAKQLSTSVTSLAFTYDNVDFTQVKNISVDLRTAETSRGETINQHLEQKIRIRNY